MSIDKFMKAIEDMTSFIGFSNDDHWGTITWHEEDTAMGIEKRSGSERRELIKKVPKKVKPKRKSMRRK